MTYPDAFYVAHRMYSGGLFNEPQWGDILDGPETDFAHVVTLCFDACDGVPTPETLRVWHVNDYDIHDETAAVIAAMADRMEALNG